jgi:hypothetical protein
MHGRICSIISMSGRNVAWRPTHVEYSEVPYVLQLWSFIKKSKKPFECQPLYRPVLDCQAIVARVEKLVTFTDSTSDIVHNIAKFSYSPPYQRNQWFTSFSN